MEGPKTSRTSSLLHGHYPKKIHQKILNMIFLELIKDQKAKWSRTFKYVSRKIIIHPKYYLKALRLIIFLGNRPILKRDSDIT